MVFTLREFIYDSGFANLKLLTCEDRLDTPVTSVNVIDNPDVTQWVQPGEMVLTTGYFFANDLNLQRIVIMNLKAAGCSALCIKVKRFFPELPENILQTAKQAGLPVIDIPLEYSFSSITLRVHEHLNNHQLQKIQKEQLLFQSLLSAYHSEHSLQNCLRLLSDFLSASLFIINDRFQCLFFYLQPSDRVLFAASDMLEIHPVQDIRPQWEPSMSLDIAVTINTFEYSASLVPFQDRELFLCIPGNPTFVSMDFIQHVMQLFRFPKEQLSRAPINVSEYYSEFFKFLLSGNTSKAKIDQICEYYGYPHCVEQICLLFSLRSEEDNYRLQAPTSYLKEILYNCSIKQSSFFLASYQRQICLYFLSNGQDYRRIASHCAEEFQKQYHEAFTVGISQPIRGDRELIKAYQQASFLLTLSNIFPNRHTFLFWDYLLFWNIKELPCQNKQKIFADTVKPLVDYDKKNHTDLLQTLLQYFDAQFNASLAAKQLYVHRNTFLKRMQKINELVPFDSENINSMLSVYYGICIYLMEQY